MAKDRAKGSTESEQAAGGMTYTITPKNEKGSVVEVKVTSGKYAGKSALIAQISSLGAYYNIKEEK